MAINRKNKTGLKIRLWAFSFYDGVFLSTLLALFAFLIAYPFLNDNNQAIIYMIQKKYQKAEKKWLKALSHNPFSPLYRLNLSLNYQLSEHTGKALQEQGVIQNFFSARAKGEKNSAGKQPISDILFFSFFNSAVAETQNNHIEQALNFYQRALSFKPLSLEVKTNIELLTKKQEGHKKGEGKSEPKNKGEAQENNSSAGDKSHKENGQKGQNQKDQEKDSDQKGGQGPEGETESLQDSQSESANKPKNLEAGTGSANESENPQVDSQNQQSRGSGRDNHWQAPDQELDEAQTSAILKAISEQEKQIKKRRQQRQKRSAPTEKDW